MKFIHPHGDAVASAEQARMQIRTVHPFPARMAPELALASLGKLRANSIVLDPMAGSGTVLRQALALGHRAIGFDMDPLAVLMSRVLTSPVDEPALELELKAVMKAEAPVDMRSQRPHSPAENKQ